MMRSLSTFERAIQQVVDFLAVIGILATLGLISLQRADFFGWLATQYPDVVILQFLATGVIP